jgi:TRAP transporter TAXI family solute receptor
MIAFPERSAMSSEPWLPDRLVLHLRGDWGFANLHRVCGWIGSGTCSHAGPGSQFAIWNGRGFSDNVRAVANGDVDVAVTTPSTFVTAALDGRGPYEGTAFPHLRALGQIPQDDRLILAVHPSLQVTSFADIQRRRAPLRISTGLMDGTNLVGWAVGRIMECEGISREALESWGGGYIEAELPNHAALSDGRANALFNEAISTQMWQDIAREGWTFLDMSDETLSRLEADYSWRRKGLAAGHFEGVEHPVMTLDFSDFLVVVREDMSDDLAYLIARVMSETRDRLERFYRDTPPARSGVTWPLDPTQMAQTPIPLHPGAERYYRDNGHL